MDRDVLVSRMADTPHYSGAPNARLLARADVLNLIKSGELSKDGISKDGRPMYRMNGES